METKKIIKKSNRHFSKNEKMYKGYNSHCPPADPWDDDDVMSALCIMSILSPHNNNIRLNATTIIIMHNIYQASIEREPARHTKREVHCMPLVPRHRPPSTFGRSPKIVLHTLTG